MMVEYRSDLNGGLDRGFWIREFGVFAKDLDGSEVMLYYGTLGDYPQWVSAYSEQGLDTRRYPVDITIGEGATVIIDYSPEAFMTSEDVNRHRGSGFSGRKLDGSLGQRTLYPKASSGIREAVCGFFSGRVQPSGASVYGSCHTKDYPGHRRGLCHEFCVFWKFYGPGREGPL